MRKHLLYIIAAVYLLWGGICKAEILIIANKNVSTTHLSQRHLREIFLGTRVEWDDKTRIHFVLNGNKKLHKEFVRKYLKRSASQFKNYWRNMLYTGKGKRPLEFQSTAELIEYVENTKGAISYIDSKTDAKTPIKNVKTIQIGKGGK